MQTTKHQSACKASSTNSTELIDSLRLTTEEKNNSIREAQTRLSLAVSVLESSFKESASTLRNALEAESRQWMAALEVQLSKVPLEMSKVHRKMLRWASIWTLTSVTVAFLATLCALWLLPYKAFPVLIQTNASQIAALEARSSDLTKQIQAKQAEFDQLKKDVADGSADLRFLEPLIGHDSSKPNAIFVKLKIDAETEPIDANTHWVRFH